MFCEPGELPQRGLRKRASALCQTLVLQQLAFTPRLSLTLARDLLVGWWKQRLSEVGMREKGRGKVGDSTQTPTTLLRSFSVKRSRK